MGEQQDDQIEASITMTALRARLERGRAQLASIDQLLSEIQQWAAGLPQNHTNGELTRVIDWSHRDTNPPSDFERTLLQLLATISEMAKTHDFVIQVQDDDIMIRPAPDPNQA